MALDSNEKGNTKLKQTTERTIAEGQGDRIVLKQRNIIVLRGRPTATRLFGAHKLLHFQS